MRAVALASIAVACVVTVGCGVPSAHSSARTPSASSENGGPKSGDARSAGGTTPSCLGQVGREFTTCLADRLTTAKYDDVIDACKDDATTSQGNNAITCVTLLPAAFYLSHRPREASQLLTRACRDLDAGKRQMLAATCVYTTAISLRPQPIAPEDRKVAIAGAAQSFASACQSDVNDVIKEASDMDQRSRGASE